jgi:hypothetical protein
MDRDDLGGLFPKSAPCGIRAMEQFSHSPIHPLRPGKNVPVGLQTGRGGLFSADHERAKELLLLHFAEHAATH